MNTFVNYELLQDFQYKNDIIPDSTILALAFKKLFGVSKKHHTQKKQYDYIWKDYVDEYWNSLQKDEIGNCYKEAVSLCAMLRSFGVSDRSCFVIIAVDKTGSHFTSLHSSVILKAENDWYGIDTTKQACSVLCLIEDINSYINLIQPYFVFNDKIAYLLKKQ